MSIIKDFLRTLLRTIGYRVTRIGPYEAFNLNNEGYQIIYESYDATAYLMKVDDIN